MLRFLISTRLVVVIALGLSLMVALNDDGSKAFLSDDEMFKNVMIGILCFSAVTIALSAFASFDIETKREFVFDIVVDMMFISATVASLAFILTRHNLPHYAVDVKAIWLGLTAWALAMLDFLISLNGGAGKLLEMDREHFARE